MIHRLQIFRNGLAAAAIAVSAAIAPAGAATSMGPTTAYIDFQSASPGSEKLMSAVSSPKPTWIEISSFSFGAGRNVVTPARDAASGLPSGKRTAEALDVVMTPGAATDTLFKDAQMGKTLPTVLLHVLRKSGGQMVPVYFITMKNVAITSIDWSGKSTDRATEHITFDYEQIEIQYNKQSESTNGSPSQAQWNVVQNKPT